MGPTSKTKLSKEIKPGSYKYDIIIIGGGSGGIACAKEAMKFKKKVAVCDFVIPTPIGTTWGLGGTCLNVGCIPKKLMHQSGIINEIAKNDLENFGWILKEKPKFSWEKLVENIQDYIYKQNGSQILELRRLGIDYFNKFAEFETPNQLLLRDERKNQEKIDGKYIVIATGGRPNYLDGVPGGGKNDKLCITSDDIFSLEKIPGKTLIIGGGYIAVETAGFLLSMDLSVTLMVRSKLLKYFDQDCVHLIEEELVEKGLKLLKEYKPIEIVSVGQSQSSFGNKRLRVKYSGKDDKIIEEEFNTVVLAVGRKPSTSKLKLNKAGVQINEETGEIKVNNEDKTNISHIFAIGDVAEGRPELTPVAIHAGKLLSRRLFNSEKDIVDYTNIPTTIFSSIEYGAIGLSEDEAIKKYGKEKLEIYHKYHRPIEYMLSPKRDKKYGYAKVIFYKGKIVGLHYFGPNAGEVTQGFGLAFKFKASKKDFGKLIGIHPTSAEVFVNLTSRKYKDPPLERKTSC